MLTESERIDLETRVICALSGCNRDGMDKLIIWLQRETDFFTAPASTRFHGAYRGGLLEHSYTVMKRLRELCNIYANVAYTPQQIAICGLLHDLCKINMYKESYRNVKNLETGKWEQVPSYAIEEEKPFGGHGSKSVFLINQFIKLSWEEASAINCHMGAWDNSTYSNPSKVYEENYLAWLLHVADECATYIDKT